MHHDTNQSVLKFCTSFNALHACFSEFCLLHVGNVGDDYSKFYCSSDVLVVRPLLHIAILVSHQELSLRFVWVGRHYHYNECLNVFGRWHLLAVLFFSVCLVVSNWHATQQYWLVHTEHAIAILVVMAQQSSSSKSVHAKGEKLRWHVSHLAEVTINLGYSQDQGYS